MRLNSSTKAKVAAALLTASTALAGSFSASAQTTASASAPDFSKCDAMHQTNPKGAIVCRVQALEEHTRLMEQRSATARRESAEARQEGSCADAIKAEIAAGRIKPESLKAALAGRSARDVGACNLMGMLTRS